MQIPHLGFGTFRLEGDVAYQSVSLALGAGFRHIDTAQAYNNEEQVGQAIADSGIARDELFVTTKVWNDNLCPSKFIDSVKTSLVKLQLEQVDMLLIHWPCPAEESNLAEVVQLLLQAQSLGLTKNIGVSNFTIEQLETCKRLISKDSFWLNQVEVHPYLQNAKLREYCDDNDIHITAYMPFAVGKVLKDAVIIDIAKVVGATPAQVVLAWVRQKGMSTIPSSTKKANIEANIVSNGVELSEQQIAAIDSLECNDRQAAPDFSPEWD